MTGYVYQEETMGVEISAKPFFVPEKSSEAQNFYFYAYTITITNNRPAPIKLLRRKWQIRDGKGHEDVVQGEGVIGETPTIAPGTHFTYTSFSPLRTPTGTMRGQYYFIDDLGNRFWAAIPLFFLRKPESFQEASSLQ